MRLATYIRVLERALRKGEPACSVAHATARLPEMATYRVLVTGFGPYGNTQINPSLAVVNTLKSDGSPGPFTPGYEIIARQVSCEFNKCIEEASAFIDELEPNAVVMLGEYPGRAMVTVERVAINYNDSTRYGVCDEAGYAPQATKVVEDGPAAYLSTPVWKSKLRRPTPSTSPFTQVNASPPPHRARPARCGHSCRHLGRRRDADVQPPHVRRPARVLRTGHRRRVGPPPGAAGSTRRPHFGVASMAGSRRWRRAPRRRCDVLVTHRKWRRRTTTSGCRR